MRLPHDRSKHLPARFSGRSNRQRWPGFHHRRAWQVLIPTHHRQALRDCRALGCGRCWKA
ncbi:hypothetical protein XVE_0595 [Xanthomonas vesicatoria ATCC 35937]|uniref:Uncharacterized protein n=1 Tax=Xanthomonas vesicatoria ATCC 35937 TaxID=925775 RepID=F0B979_9XANT|nr:hypothetical protein XVE_0595 [Xanthomonas vesicatoria ATCC 35937]